MWRRPGQCLCTIQAVRSCAAGKVVCGARMGPRVCEREIGAAQTLAASMERSIFPERGMRGKPEARPGHGYTPANAPEHPPQNQSQANDLMEDSGHPAAGRRTPRLPPLDGSKMHLYPNIGYNPHSFVTPAPVDTSVRTTFPEPLKRHEKQPPVHIRIRI